jgi:hypothetical protein
MHHGGGTSNARGRDEHNRCFAAMSLTFSSYVDERWRPALEALLFFNSGQSSVRQSLEAVVEEFGSVELRVTGAKVAVAVERLPQAQALFALDTSGKPVGCAVFCRDAPERFLVVHLAVEPSYTTSQDQQGHFVLMRLVGAMRDTARKVRGVERLEFLYGVLRGKSLAVRSSAGSAS